MNLISPLVNFMLNPGAEFEITFLSGVRGTTLVEKKESSFGM